MKVLEIGLKYGKYLYKLKSVRAKVGLELLRVSNAIFLYFLVFSTIFPPLFGWLLGQFCEPKLPPIDPTMEIAFAKHDLRNILAIGENGIRADRPELQCKMNVENHAFYTALYLWPVSSDPIVPKGQNIS